MEKRMTERYNIPLRAIVTFTGAPRQEIETLNISGDGAFFMTNQTMPEGTRFFMSLFMDDIPAKNPVVMLEGTVKRRSTSGMGVYFDQRQQFSWM
ncbi:MAG: PilZ domain-containing protein [Desulfobulbaceae bacterium]|nr:PilZ domain-containing protein [Desulfobulbaceae bacterium]